MSAYSLDLGQLSAESPFLNENSVNTGKIILNILGWGFP